jgi:hypothetical protein
MNDEQTTQSEQIKMPAPTAWPMLMAFGVTLAFAGLVTNVAVTLAGMVFTIAGIVGWFREVLPFEHTESIAVTPALNVPRAQVAVAYLEVGEMGNRAVLPLEIYPYSAGIKGGIAGGIVMAALAVIHGVLLHGSPWYTINILAATGIGVGEVRHAATLSSFIPSAFIVAMLIHGVASILIGLLYGVLLPMAPRYPAFFAAIVAPLLWTGLLWASLSVINPLLDARIEWRWFIVCQIAFGAVAGYVVDRTEKVRTLQHLPFAVRSGIESPGIMRERTGEEPEK